MTGQPIQPTDRDREVARELLHALGLSWPVETELSVASVIADARAEGYEAGRARGWVDGVQRGHLDAIEAQR